MAVRASLELHVLVTRRPARLVWLMALLARNLDVQSSQRVAGLRVIELLCRFPIREVVTLQAIVSQLTLVHILVARHAVLCQSEKGLGKILHLYERALLGNHVARRVALFTSNAGMLAFQYVACELMVELLLRWLPVNQAEVFSIVIQVAPHAVLAIGIGHSQARVIAVVQG